MVWGGIIGGRKTDLVIIIGNLNGYGYVDNVLRPVAVPFFGHQPGYSMHDNARPHPARLTKAFIARHDVNVLPRPACSHNHVINNINAIKNTCIRS